MTPCLRNIRANAELVLWDQGIEVPSDRTRIIALRCAGEVFYMLIKVAWNNGAVIIGDENFVVNSWVVYLARHKQFLIELFARSHFGYDNIDIPPNLQTG